MHQQGACHPAEPRGPEQTLAEWKQDRPELFRKNGDGLIGPNSRHHITVLGDPGPAVSPGWEQAERMLRIAGSARGFGDDEYRDMVLTQIPGAWSEFGGWALPTLKQELAEKQEEFRDAGGRGVALAEAIDRMVMVVALREEGFESVDVLTVLNAED